MNKLNFGCGTKIIEGWDNVDIQKEKRIMKSFDFNKFPYPLKKNHYDFILINNVLEHLEKPEEVLYELWKSCKKNAEIQIIVPYYNNKGAYNDISHLHYFSDSTFKNFVEEPCNLDKKVKFEVSDISLKPTKVGKLLPKKLREKMSLFIGGLISQIYVRLRAVRD